MFHSGTAGSGGYGDGGSSFHQHHLQQSPVYVPSSRSMAQYPSPASGHFGASAHQSSWAHAGSTYGDVAGPSAHTLGASPHHASALSAGQFYAQNMMMSSWRAYDGTGFQRTSPYGESSFFLNLSLLRDVIQKQVYKKYENLSYLGIDLDLSPLE